MKTQQLNASVIDPGDGTEYIQILNSFSIPYKEDEVRIHFRPRKSDAGWILYVAVKINQIEEMLTTVLPLLTHLNIPFSLIKSRRMAFKVNGLNYTMAEAGKILWIYPADEQQAISLANTIEKRTVHLEGPFLEDCLRLGKVLYASYQNSITNGANNEAPTLYVPLVHPFTIAKSYQPLRKKKLIKLKYLPMETLQESPKGDVLKVISLYKPMLAICVIKKGIGNTFEDINGRDIRDRLRWQASVYNKLAGLPFVPQLIEYFEIDHVAYLVTAFTDGEPLIDYLEKIYQIRCWPELIYQEQQVLLNLAISCANMLSQLHERGWMHRDLTAANIMVSNEQQVSLLDFELAYNYQQQIPDPPFFMGTPGYVSKEQRMGRPPTCAEDIFSFGAVLTAVFSGKSPLAVYGKQTFFDTEKLQTLKLPDNIGDIISWCMHPDPTMRPNINDVKSMLTGIKTNTQNEKDCIH
jgi:serine/threonine protein kinase